ncbi:MAG: hypothetical protein JNL51_01350 [Chitinophagaceae bacterium]|nr:hypothetical protein [Chitinophagaceae bacterium]
MKTIRQTLFHNWHVMRWVRLGLGAYVAVYAFRHTDILSGFIAAFFLIQAFTNTGCSGGSCAIPPPKSHSDKNV